MSAYFTLTTLSTTGYGDYTPTNNVERIVSLLLMLGGVAFFSYIIGNFIDIISNYDKKMGLTDKSGELTEYLDTLRRFNNLPKSLTMQIENHFSYHWANDRLAFIDKRDDYLGPLPVMIKNQILNVYLFKDVFDNFGRFFGLNSKY